MGITQMSVEVINSANQYQMMCYVDTDSPDQYLEWKNDWPNGTLEVNQPPPFPEGYTFPMSSITWFDCHAQGIHDDGGDGVGGWWPTTSLLKFAFVLETHAIAFNQTWICDNEDGTNQTCVLLPLSFLFRV